MLSWACSEGMSPSIVDTWILLAVITASFNSSLETSHHGITISGISMVPAITGTSVELSTRVPTMLPST